VGDAGGQVRHRGPPGGLRVSQPPGPGPSRLLGARGPLAGSQSDQRLAPCVAGLGDTQRLPPSPNHAIGHAPPPADGGGRLAPHRTGQFLIDQEARVPALAHGEGPRPGERCVRPAGHYDEAVQDEAVGPITDTQLRGFVGAVQQLHPVIDLPRHRRSLPPFAAIVGGHTPACKQKGRHGWPPAGPLLRAWVSTGGTGPLSGPRGEGRPRCAHTSHAPSTGHPAALLT
jgi:hypothetical protein